MDLDAIRQRLADFNRARGWGAYHAPKNLAMALAAEVGELVEVFQWLTEEESTNLADGQMAAAREEIADVAIMLILLADSLGIELGPAIQDKIDRNAEKYPVVGGT